MRPEDVPNAQIVVGFVGNCQAELLQKAFSAATARSRYTSFYHFSEIAGDRRDSARADISRCDILLLQDIQDVEDYPLRADIAPGARIVTFPFLRFAAPWPYDDFNGMRDKAARAQDDPALHTSTYYDSVLGRLRRSLPDPEARFRAYETLAVDNVLDPLRVLDFEQRRLGALDEKFGCAIGRYILENFRTGQLFYAVNRPCGRLLAMVLDMICRAAGIDAEEACAAPESSTVDLDALRAIECPVHPKVAHILGLAWATADRRYNSGGARLTFEEHVRAYIARYG